MSIIKSVVCAGVARPKNILYRSVGIGIALYAVKGSLSGFYENIVGRYGTTVKKTALKPIH